MEGMRKRRALKSSLTHSSPKEAAGVLRQMQSLMLEFGPDHHALEICSKGTRRAPGTHGTPWRMRLAALIAGAFQTRVLCMGDATQHVFQFYGELNACEVSVYAYRVLLRQIVAARKAHLRRVRILKNRIARGDDFAMGWLDIVSDALGQPSMGAELERRIEFHINALYPDRITILPGTCANRMARLSQRETGRDIDRSMLQRTVTRELSQRVQLRWEFGR